MYDTAEAPQPFDFLEFFAAVIRQQFLAIIAATILAAGLGLAYVYTAVPTYAAKATLIIDPGKTQAQLGGMLREMPIVAMEAESQIQLIRSEAVALAVIKKLNLTEDPEFAPSPESLTKKGWLDWLRSMLLPSKSGPPDPTQVTLANIASRLIVNHVGGNVIEIEFRSRKPVRAAEIANAFADCYIEDQLKFRYQSARQAASWLEGRIQELGDQSALADEAVVQFRAKNNIVAAGGQLITERQLTELNTQLVLAREKTSEARARFDRIDAIIHEDPSTGQGGAVAETLNNPIIVTLRARYLELVNREADWSRRFGADHEAVANVKRQIQEIRNSMMDELRRVAETYKSDYEIAKQRQAEIERTVAEAVSSSQDMSQAQIELRRLESTAEAYRSLYNSVLQRNTELGQQESFPGTEARLITRAAAPLQKRGPKNSVILLASALGGAMLGVALGMARMALDRVFRTPAQVEALLQADCLALVPVLKAETSLDDMPPAEKGSRLIRRTESIVWQAVDRPLARFAESMRSIKSAADVSARPAKVLGFTSALPGEGKSIVGASFAVLAAQSKAKTILVDCDLRHPALTELLAPEAEYGFLDVLSGKKALEDVVWTEPDTNLVFLPGAMNARTANSSDILASSDLRKLIAELRKTYDYIVLDFPPTAPIVDVRSTAGLVDAYVFVVEWASTKMQVAELALEKTAVVRANLLGVVLNKVDFKKLGRYDSHRNDYYSDKYYAQYGDT
jgi:succinoglycan biosynthesis transport protein ExoP